MSIAALVGVGLAIWFALALALALIIGRVIRARDKQIPRTDDDATSSSPPHQRARKKFDEMDEPGP